MSSGGHLLSRYHRRGDADAFCALVRDHAGMVFATAKRVVGDAALAEDVAQETFLELARKGHDAVESVAAWLHRVAWRKACNAVRCEARRRQREQAAAETFGATTEASWSDLEPLIDEALEELPPRLRECLVEHYLEGRTQQELAVRMGVNRSTVSRQLDEGVRTLRSLLRAKGIQCGAGLVAVLGAGSAPAAPSSLTASLGKLAICGMGASASGTAGIAVGATLFTMNVSKVTLTIAAVAAFVSVPVVVFHRTHTDEKTKLAAAPANSPPSRPTSAQQTAKARPGAAKPLYYRPAPQSENVRRKVDDLIRRFRGMTKEQLGQSLEIAALSVPFEAALNSPETEQRMKQAFEAMRAVKGDNLGMVAMSFGEPDSPEFRAWLEAVVSGDRKQVQDWILNRLEGAVFEFGLDPDLKQSSDGVSVHPRPPVKPQADEKEND